MSTHHHTYALLSTTMLSLPTAAGLYECLLIYRCSSCRRVDCFTTAIDASRALPTWQEVMAVAQWQQDRPAVTRAHLAGTI